MEKIRSELSDCDLWFTVDETTDSKKRHIANLLVGKMTEQGAAPAYLVASQELERCNNQTVARFVNNGLRKHYKILLFFNLFLFIT